MLKMILFKIIFYLKDY